MGHWEDLEKIGRDPAGHMFEHSLLDDDPDEVSPAARKPGLADSPVFREKMAEAKNRVWTPEEREQAARRRKRERTAVLSVLVLLAGILVLTVMQGRDPRETSAAVHPVDPPAQVLKTREELAPYLAVAGRTALPEDAPDTDPTVSVMGVPGTVRYGMQQIGAQQHHVTVTWQSSETMSRRQYRAFLQSMTEYFGKVKGCPRFRSADGIRLTRGWWDDLYAECWYSGSRVFLQFRLLD